MQTKITEVNINWLAIKNACRKTVSMKDSTIEPTTEWKRKLLICRHSPIRKGSVTFRWDEIPYAISTHFARHHEGCEKFISTSREDRTGVNRTERSQMDPVQMEMMVNIEAILNISERRLCTCADKTTLMYWKSFLEELKKVDPDIYWASVPQCVVKGGCCEPFSDCKFYENLMKDADMETQMSLVKRYNHYNERRK